MSDRPRSRFSRFPLFPLLFSLKNPHCSSFSLIPPSKLTFFKPLIFLYYRLNKNPPSPIQESEPILTKANKKGKNHQKLLISKFLKTQNIRKERKIFLMLQLCYKGFPIFIKKKRYKKNWHQNLIYIIYTIKKRCQIF